MKKSLVITRGDKLYSRDGWLIVEQENKSKKKVFIDELKTVIIDNTNMTITIPTLITLSEHNVNVIVDGKNHLPLSEIHPVNSSYKSVATLKKQILMSDECKDREFSDTSEVSAVINRLTSSRPREGDVRFLKLSEKQFLYMGYSVDASDGVIEI